MRSIRRQAGVTGIGWMIILGLMGFFVFLTLKMLPSYLEYFKVVSSLESLEKESVSSPVEIRKHIERRFDVGYVYVITPKQVKIKNAGKVYKVTAKYDSQVHLFANVDVLMSFYKQVEVSRR
jgi:predicted glycosyltransferase involved in capsule biosynthesis